MISLTVFANFRINDQERFYRMRDSFLSIKDIGAKRWVINARGKYKLETLFFLHDHLGDKLSAYVLESERGWFEDSRKMLPEINSDFVLSWVEDHVNLVDAGKYRDILNEMKSDGSEILCYSWWHQGRLKQRYNSIPKKEYSNIETFILDKATNMIVQRNHANTFIVSAVSIFSTELFKRIINKNDPLLRRWPKDTPFDLEKNGKDIHWLPIKLAIPKYELFAPIDDDVSFPGYSLQSRNLYPKRVTRQDENCAVRRPSFTGRLCRKILPVSIKHFLKRVSYHF